MKDTASSHRPVFLLLGASLDTGNLGVSALMAATVKCIRHAYPNARVRLLEGTRVPREEVVRLADGQRVRLDRVGVRFNKTPWRANHILRLLAVAAAARLMPVRAWRERIVRANTYLHAIASAHCVADVTGGDSFSDIYGLRRLVLGTLAKGLVLAAGADLVLLPQTYGPFAGRIGRALARFVLARASGVYSRDREGLEVVNTLMACRRMRARPMVCPDVAFVLDAIAPAEVRTVPGPLPDSSGGGTLVGLNVSGLLWNGGYTRANMFGLRDDYRAVVEAVARALLAREGVTLLLVPHVFTPAGHVESDPDACRALQDRLSDAFAGRVLRLEGEYDPSEIKHVIGRCGFFVGSRMHACIAAASQGIATVPLAYSRKFAGVFEVIGQGDCVVDLRRATAGEAADAMMRVFDSREEAARRLGEVLPGARRRVFASVGRSMELEAPVTSGAAVAGAGR